MEHSTPTTSPIRNEAELRALSLSPIENEAANRSLEQALGGNSTASPRSVQYIDEWVMEQSRCTEYLEFIDSTLVGDHSTTFEESSLDSHASLDSAKSNSNRHSIDNSFFRVWIEADSMESQLCFLEECTLPKKESTTDDSIDYDETGDTGLEELMLASAKVKELVAPNKSLQEIPFGQIELKKGGASLDLRQVQSAPRPLKQSRLSLFKKLIGRN